MRFAKLNQEKPFLKRALESYRRFDALVEEPIMRIGTRFGRKTVAFGTFGAATLGLMAEQRINPSGIVHLLDSITNSHSQPEVVVLVESLSLIGLIHACHIKLEHEKEVKLDNLIERMLQPLIRSFDDILDSITNIFRNTRLVNLAVGISSVVACVSFAIIKAIAPEILNDQLTSELIALPLPLKNMTPWEIALTSVQGVWISALAISSYLLLPRKTSVDDKVTKTPSTP
ncbi:MAG: hypothetical protein Q7S22_01605 [Candidatus Micrarchaeota archaeon]|nr:hypothetical protein [Candidatus Micrarchaeota archaeon]